VNGVQPDGMTALIWAAHNDNFEVADLLIKSGASAKVASRYGLTPITEAATNGDAAIIELVLKAGADPNTTLAEGDNALMLASRTGNPATVKVLLDHGAMVNAKEGWHGETALMWAAGQNHAEVVRMLIKAGADVNAQATHLNYVDMPKSGASVFSSYPAGGLTALMEAARDNSIEAAQALLDNGADPNIKDPGKLIALTVAIENAHWDMAHLLIEHGSELNDGALPAAIDAKTALVVRASSNHEDKLKAGDIIAELLTKGAKPDSLLIANMPAKKALGGGPNAPLDSTGLYRAAKMADVETMKLLLAKGADPKIVLKDGSTPLLAAAGMGGRGGAGAVTGGPTDDQMAAAVKLCLENGADIGVTDNTGMTALHHAAAKGSDAVVQLLADKGAKLDATDKRGRTALDVAMGLNGKELPGAPAPGGGGGAARLDVHYSTAALLRKLMGLPAEDGKISQVSGEEKVNQANQ